MRDACNFIRGDRGHAVIASLLACDLPCCPGRCRSRPAQAAARELRLSHQLPESDARHRAARVLAAELKKRAPDLTISIHPNSSLVDDPAKQYEALLEGKIEMADLPDGLCLGEVPGAVRRHHAGRAVERRGGQPAQGHRVRGASCSELCEEKGFRILTWWWLDGGMASRARQITGPDERQGADRAQRRRQRLSTACSRRPAPRIAAMPLSEVRTVDGERASSTWRRTRSRRW